MSTANPAITRPRAQHPGRPHAHQETLAAFAFVDTPLSVRSAMMLRDSRLLALAVQDGLRGAGSSGQVPAPTEPTFTPTASGSLLLVAAGLFLLGRRRRPQH
ncbi:hypothetical protein [Streptomyces sp. NPDC048428]|uniref:hypothetical protein n=1 Tax=Streptomyces sp. NPDC048428 TaxID=3154503 RepID=UPI003423A80E